MPLIIDCYNLLHQTMPPSLAGLDEARLCRLLSANTWLQEGGATVVCDGSPKPAASKVRTVAGVTVVYSGQRRSADDVIRAMLRKSSAPRRLTVVSNDKEVQQAAKRRRARVLTCQAFIGLMAAPPRPDGSQGPGCPKPEDVLSAEQWAAEFGLDPQTPLDDMDE